MTNHVHLLATPVCSNGLSRMMQYIGRHYVRYFNYVYKRTGTLWEGRYKSCLVQDDCYFLRCQRYIELNPVRAKMVSNPADYDWSSYRANAMGIDSKLLTPHTSYLSLGKTKSERLDHYRSLFKEALSDSTVQEIREANHHGLVFGNQQFKDEVALLTGQSVELEKRGRKAKARD